ncbi:hypothetical protein L226DRAFT_377110 [Lentinus tigrinus ALCF2SS1-7]|uniref:Uncharacterized protein n=1 Tax=Lentinus tigrinus ALCF2SS1-6 TaxID=1328759 RepID=A0A5C2SKB5_9APHY|nr:hypothetical protein L227DRAFT_322899 [Lentinus tigrinus ALCF2SS1-6]RPD76453.1 hypothetical protein L226DRAFT_377110 [Lentinus tigrinus ALCF2SS1-7]
MCGACGEGQVGSALSLQPATSSRRSWLLLLVASSWDESRASSVSSYRSRPAGTGARQEQACMVMWVPPSQWPSTQSPMSVHRAPCWNGCTSDSIPRPPQPTSRPRCTQRACILAQLLGRVGTGDEELPPRGVVPNVPGQRSLQEDQISLMSPLGRLLVTAWMTSPNLGHAT